MSLSFNKRISTLVWSSFRVKDLHMILLLLLLLDCKTCCFISWTEPLSALVKQIDTLLSISKRNYSKKSQYKGRKILGKSLQGHSPVYE